MRVKTALWLNDGVNFGVNAGIICNASVNAGVNAGNNAGIDITGGPLRVFGVGSVCWYGCEISPLRMAPGSFELIARIEVTT